jgi:hypothetical protein
MKASDEIALKLETKKPIIVINLSSPAPRTIPRLECEG